MKKMLTLTHATERDIDLLFIEEFVASESFSSWFLSQLELDEFQAGKVSVFHSKRRMHNRREIDISVDISAPTGVHYIDSHRCFAQAFDKVVTYEAVYQHFNNRTQTAPDEIGARCLHRANLIEQGAATHGNPGGTLEAHRWTTNSIGSVYATVRNRTRKTKGCLNRKTALSMVFKLMMFQEIPLHVNWIKDEGFLASDAPGSTGLYAQIYWSEHAVRIGQSSNMAIRSALAGRV